MKWALFLSVLLCGGGIAETRAQAVVRKSSRTIEVQGEMYFIHEVARKETLYSIAKAYGVTQEAIMKANGLRDSAIKKKQSLLIPSGKKTGPVIESKKEPSDAPKETVIFPGTPPQTGDGREGLPEIEGIESEKPQVASKIKDFDQRGVLNIGLMLPAGAGTRADNQNFADFYRGVLLGLNALKQEGISTSLKVLDTGRSTEKIEDHIRAGKLKAAHLIIGPVYADNFAPVAQYAMQEGIPVVSPLGHVGEEDNPFVFEVAPPTETMYDKIFEMFGSDHVIGDDGTSRIRNTVIIEHGAGADQDVLNQVKTAFAGKPNVHTISYLPILGNKARSDDINRRLTAMLDANAENIIFVPVGKESAVEEVLSRISSINIKTWDKYRVTVVGTSNWWRFSNMNLDLYFKLNVHYPTSYHADRTDPAVEQFYRDYIHSFGSVPTLFSFRGYDVVKYFASAMRRFGPDMPSYIVENNSGGFHPSLLQVKYVYKNDGAGKYRNLNWPVVNYRPGYTIQVK